MFVVSVDDALQGYTAILKASLVTSADLWIFSLPAQVARVSNGCAPFIPRKKAAPLAALDARRLLITFKDTQRRKLLFV
jgi:hypothetical protein